MTPYKINDQLYGILTDTDWFHDYARAHPKLRFFWPNKVKSPWQLTLKIDNAFGEPTHMQLYPHKTRAVNPRTGEVVSHIKAIVKLISDELDYAAHSFEEKKVWKEAQDWDPSAWE